MSAHYTIQHRLHFHYTDPIWGSSMTLYVHPIQDGAQVLRNFSLKTTPDGAVFHFTDCFGNQAHFFDRPEYHKELIIEISSAVEINASPRQNLDPLGTEGWEILKAAREDSTLWPFLHPSRFVHWPKTLEKFMTRHELHPKDNPLESAQDLCTRLHNIFDYTPGSTQADSSIDSILETGQGVCQDYAHVMTSILRHWGIPCRYISGHLGPQQEGESHGECHAWVEAWFGPLGWRGFDPTNDTPVDKHHIRVAVGRDYADVPPARGVFQGAAGSHLETNVTAMRITP
ncbi:MAG: transglutaminase family protein [Bacteriovoracales bacterium]|nr:transglutaminase family protein [Bacteriovoracales bacterium]